MKKIILPANLTSLLTRKFILPMSVGNSTTVEKVTVTAKLCDDNSITLSAIENRELYGQYSFYIDYFMWLLHTGYIQVIKES